MDEQAYQNENTPSFGDGNNELENNDIVLMQEEDSTEDDRSPNIDAINETQAEVTSEQPEENSENMEEAVSVPVGEIAISEMQEELVYNLPTQTISSPGIDDELEKPFIRHVLSQEESVIFDHAVEVEVALTRQVETSERGTISPVQVEEEEEALASAGPEEQDIIFDKHMQLLQLHAEKGKLNWHNAQLQVKLSEYFRKKSGESIQPQNWKLISDVEQNCTMYLAIKLEHARNSEITQQQARELNVYIIESRRKVDKECQVFTALKHDVALTLLSRQIGKQAAKAKIEQILASEEAQHDKIIQLLVENIKLQKILTLEAMFSTKAEWQDSERLRTHNQDVSEKIAKRNEDLHKLRKKTAGTIAVLTHIKERFQWNQMHNQVKRAQLAEMEVIIAKERDLLSRLKQARNSLQVDNQKLKDRCGLLVNSVLLRDFEDQLDTFVELEEDLRCLKHRQNQVNAV